MEENMQALMERLNSSSQFLQSGSLTLANSQNSQMSFRYGFFYVKFLFFNVVCVVYL